LAQQILLRQQTEPFARHMQKAKVAMQFTVLIPMKMQISKENSIFQLLRFSNFNNCFHFKRPPGGLFSFIAI
jgi:hypothetical protein